MNTESKMKVHLKRHLEDGSQTMTPCEIAVLKTNKLEEAIAAHDEITAGLSEDIYITSDRATMKRFFSEEGLVVGVSSGDRIIALRTLVTGREFAKICVEECRIKYDPDVRYAVTGLCVVHKCFRGNNVQFMTQYFAESLVKNTHDRIFTTVSPRNIFSLQNLFECGYDITDIKTPYGGHLRYVMQKIFHPALPVQTRRHLTIPIRDIESQKKAIANGRVGYKMILKPSAGFHVLYGKAAVRA